MSAWIVSNKHIDTLVTAIRSHNGVKTVYHNGVSVDLTALSDTDLGSLLLEENIKSVDHRYKESNVLKEYNYRCQPYYKPMDIVKSCKCYNYQSCEHEEWDTSLAKTIISSLKDKYVQMILDRNGYDDAPWGIDEWGRDDPKTISLMSMMK